MTLDNQICAWRLLEPPVAMDVGAFSTDCGKIFLGVDPNDVIDCPCCHHRINIAQEDHDGRDILPTASTV